MDNVFILIERTLGIFLFCLALSFQLGQLRQWEETLRLLQVQVELEHDIGFQEIN